MTEDLRLELARSSLRHVTERQHLLDAVADGRAGVGDLLSAACQLQLDLQNTALGETASQARALARQLCSTLSHVAPGRHSEIRTARQTLRQIEDLLSPHRQVA